MSTTTHIVASKPSSSGLDWAATASSSKPWHIECEPALRPKDWEWDRSGTERWIRALVEVILREQLERDDGHVVGVGMHIEVEPAESVA